MPTVHIRKQGGAAIMTIPAEIMRMLKVDIGASLALDVDGDAFIARPVSLPESTQKRYSLKELLRGVTPELMTEINAETEWAREGDPVGRELL